MQFFKKKEEKIFIVEEISSDAVTKLLVVSEEHPLRLCKDKCFYQAILTCPQNQEKCFSLFKISSEVEAKEMFVSFNSKLVLNLDVFGVEVMDKEHLQKLTDGIRLNAGYSLAHLAVLLENPSLFKKDAVKSLINKPDEETKETPLFIAVDMENEKMVKALLAAGATLEAVDSHGNSVFHRAARANSSEVIKILGLKDKSKINALNSLGQAPLHEACIKDLPSNVMELLSLGADPCATEHPTYPIHLALQTDSLRSIELLCKAKKCQSNRKDKTKEDTPLHWARSKEALGLLLRLGAELEERNSKGETALMRKVKDISYAEVIACLCKGADINAADNEGNTPLGVAIMEDNPQLVKLLLAFGAEVNVKSEEGEEKVPTPRHRAATGPGKNKEAIIYYLHLAGAERCSLEMKNCSSCCSTKGTNNGKAPKGLEHPHQVIENELTPDAVMGLGKHSEVEALKKAEDRVGERESRIEGVEGEEKVEEKKSVEKLRELKRESPGHKILSINAGRLEGLVMIKALIHLEEMCKKPVKECFDWIAGSGSGAFIALAIMQDRPLKSIFNVFLELCQETVFNKSNPCTEKEFESRLKNIFGEDKKMSDYSGTRVLTTACRWDERPLKKVLCRNYELPGTTANTKNKVDHNMKPGEILCWRAAKWSGFADAGFSGSSKCFMDGWLLGNDPTMDALMEVHQCNTASRKKGGEGMPIHCVVSMGGECSMTEVSDGSKVENVEKLMGEGRESFVRHLLLEHSQHTDTHTAMQAKAWCHMAGAPLFRFHPCIHSLPRPNEVMEDTACLVSLLWEADVYLKKQRSRMERIACLLA